MTLAKTMLRSHTSLLESEYREAKRRTSPDLSEPSGKERKPIKIGMVHYSFTPGGVGGIMNRHASLLTAGGVHVEILAGHVGIPSREGVKVEREASFEFYGGGDQEEMYCRLKAWVQGKDAVIVHNVLTQPHGNRDLYAVLRERLIPEERGKRRFVAWTHDTEPQIERIDGVQYTAISEKTQKELEGLRPHRGVPLTSNAIDYRGFLTPRLYSFFNKHELWDQDYLFLYPARWAENKNLERAIGILAAFKRQLRKQAKLVIVPCPASPFYEEDMKRLIQEKGLEAEVILTREELDSGVAWIPADAEMERLYQLSDALLFTSWQEGFGLPVIEAALGKTPVVTLDVSPHGDLLGGASLRLPSWRNNFIEDALDIQHYLDKENKTVAAARRVRQQYNLEKVWREVILGVLGLYHEKPKSGARSSIRDVRPSGETYPIEEQLERASKDGFKVFEVFIDGFRPSQIYADTRRRLLDRAVELGIELQVHAPILGGSSPEEEAVQLADAVLFTRDVGAKTLVLRMDPREEFAPVLARLLSKARQAGVRLALENGPRDTSKSLNEVITRLRSHEDVLGFAFNVGFASLVQSPLQYLNDLRGQILTVYLHDTSGDGTEPSRIGTGGVDFRRLVPGLLERVGPGIPQILGYWHPQRRADRLLLESSVSKLTRIERSEGESESAPLSDCGFPATVRNARLVGEGTAESAQATSAVLSQLPAARAAIADTFGTDVERILESVDLKVTSPEIPEAVADTDRVGRIGVNYDVARRVSPEQLRVVLIHELLHIVYPDSSEFDVSRLTLRTLEQAGLLVRHREYLTQQVAMHQAAPQAFVVLPTEAWLLMVREHPSFTKRECEGDFQNILIRDEGALVAAHVQISTRPGRRVIVAMPAGKAALCFETTQDVQWTVGEDLVAFAEVDGQRGVRFTLSTDGEGVSLASGSVLLHHMLMARFGVLEEERRLTHLFESGSIREVESRLGMSLHDLEDRNRVLGPALDSPNNKLTFSKRSLDGKHRYQLELVVDPAFGIDLGETTIRIFRKASHSRTPLRLTVCASVDFAPLTPLPLDELLNEKGKALVARDAHFRRAVRNFEFLFFAEKPLAGSLNYQSYFGRDDQISLRNMWSVLSDKAKRVGVQSVLDQVSADGRVNVTDEWTDDRSHADALVEFFKAYDKNDLDEARRLMRQLLEGSVPAHPWFDVLDPTFMFPATALYTFRDMPDAELRAWLVEDHAVLGRLETRLTTLLRNWNFILDAAGPYGMAWQDLRRKYPESTPRDTLLEHRDEFRDTAKMLVRSVGGMGNWRDSIDLLGYGRFPEDINVNLIPSAIQAIPRAVARIAEAGLAGALLDTAKRHSLDAVARGLEDPERFGGLAEAWDWSLVREHYLVRRSVAEVRRDLRRHIEEIDPNQFAGDESRSRAEREVLPRRRIGRDARGDVTVADFLYADRVPDELADGLEFTALVLDEYGTPFPAMHSDDIYWSLFGTPTPEQFRKILRTVHQSFPLGLGFWDDHAGFVVSNICFAPSSWGIWGWKGEQLRAAFSPVRYHGAVAWGWVFSALLCGIREQVIAGIHESGTLRNGLTRDDVLLFQRLLLDCQSTIGELSPLVNSELWQYVPENDASTGRVHARPIGVSTPIQLWSVAPKEMLIEEALERIELALGKAAAHPGAQ